MDKSRPCSEPIGKTEWLHQMESIGLESLKEQPKTDGDLGVKEEKSSNSPLGDRMLGYSIIQSRTDLKTVGTMTYFQQSDISPVQSKNKETSSVKQASTGTSTDSVNSCCMKDAQVTIRNSTLSLLNPKHEHEGISDRILVTSASEGQAHECLQLQSELDTAIKGIPRDADCMASDQLPELKDTSDAETQELLKSTSGYTISFGGSDLSQIGTEHYSEFIVHQGALHSLQPIDIEFDFLESPWKNWTQLQGTGETTESLDFEIDAALRPVSSTFADVAARGIPFMCDKVFIEEGDVEMSGSLALQEEKVSIDEECSLEAFFSSAINNNRVSTKLVTEEVLKPDPLPSMASNIACALNGNDQTFKRENSPSEVGHGPKTSPMVQVPEVPDPCGHSKPLPSEGDTRTNNMAPTLLDAPNAGMVFGKAIDEQRQKSHVTAEGSTRSEYSVSRVESSSVNVENFATQFDGGSTSEVEALKLVSDCQGPEAKAMGMLEGKAFGDQEDQSYGSITKAHDSSVQGHLYSISSRQHVLEITMKDASSSDTGISEQACMVGSAKFVVGDLVWAKVKSHPWWPGQIFDSADASPSAKRIQKPGRVLVAFFGDQTYGWLQESQLISFRPNFTEKVKQTTMKSFCKAVSQALDEVCRRVELGLCFSDHKQLYSAGTFPDENAGIRKGVRLRTHRDISTASEDLKPSSFIEYIRNVAASPLSLWNCAVQDAVFRGQAYAFHNGTSSSASLVWQNPSKTIQQGLVTGNHSVQSPFPNLKRKCNVSAEESKNSNFDQALSLSEKDSAEFMKLDANSRIQINKVLESVGSVEEDEDNGCERGEESKRISWSQEPKCGNKVKSLHSADIDGIALECSQQGMLELESKFEGDGETLLALAGHKSKLLELKGGKKANVARVDGTMQEKVKANDKTKDDGETLLALAGHKSKLLELKGGKKTNVAGVDGTMQEKVDVNDKSEDGETLLALSGYNLKLLELTGNKKANELHAAENDVTIMESSKQGKLEVDNKTEDDEETLFALAGYNSKFRELKRSKKAKELHVAETGSIQQEELKRKDRETLIALSNYNGLKLLELKGSKNDKEIHVPKVDSMRLCSGWEKFEAGNKSDEDEETLLAIAGYRSKLLQKLEKANVLQNDVRKHLKSPKKELYPVLEGGKQENIDTLARKRKCVDRDVMDEVESKTQSKADTIPIDARRVKHIVKQQSKLANCVNIAVTMEPMETSTVTVPPPEELDVTSVDDFPGSKEASKSLIAEVCILTMEPTGPHTHNFDEEVKRDVVRQHQQSLKVEGFFPAIGSDQQESIGLSMEKGKKNIVDGSESKIRGKTDTITIHSSIKESVLEQKSKLANSANAATLNELNRTCIDTVSSPNELNITSVDTDIVSREFNITSIAEACNSLAKSKGSHAKNLEKEEGIRDEMRQAQRLSREKFYPTFESSKQENIEKPVRQKKSVEKINSMDGPYSKIQSKTGKIPVNAGRINPLVEQQRKLANGVNASISKKLKKGCTHIISPSKELNATTVDHVSASEKSNKVSISTDFILSTEPKDSHPENLDIEKEAPCPPLLQHNDHLQKRLKTLEVGENEQKISSEITGTPVSKCLDGTVGKKAFSDGNMILKPQKVRTVSVSGLQKDSRHKVYTNLPIKKKTTFIHHLQNLLVLAKDPLNSEDTVNSFSFIDIFLKFRDIVFQKSAGYAASPPRVHRNLVDKADAFDDGTCRIGDTKSSSLSSDFLDIMPADGGEDCQVLGSKVRKRKLEIQIESPGKISGKASVLVSSRSVPSQLETTRKGSIIEKQSSHIIGGNNEKHNSGSSISPVFSRKNPRELPDNCLSFKAPAALLMKFPESFALPSEAQLKATFIRFGALDTAATRVYYNTASAQVVFKHGYDAEMALKYAQENTLFGQAFVKFRLRHSHPEKISVRQNEPSSVKDTHALMDEGKTAFLVSKTEESRGVRREQQQAGQCTMPSNKRGNSMMKSLEAPLPSPLIQAFHSPTTGAMVSPTVLASSKPVSVVRESQGDIKDQMIKLLHQVSFIVGTSNSVADNS